MKIFQSVKTKVAAVVLVFMTVLAVLLFLLNFGMSERYKKLQTAQCQSAVDAESQVVNEIISTMENNVRKLALIGELLAATDSDIQDLDALGQNAVEQSFPVEAVAVGGGIFYSGFALSDSTERICYYAFRNDSGEVVFDPDFSSEDYDYLTQDWYTTIKEAALENPTLPVWTTPYYDDAGTNSLMVTVGFGMFDNNGGFLGVATGDWELTDISRSIAAIRPTYSSSTLFADLSSGMVLTYSLAKEGETLSLSDFLWLDDGLKTGSAKVNGADSLLFSNILSNKMTIVSIVPKSELFAEINRYALGVQLATILGCAAIVVVIMLMLRWLINKPVTALNASVKRIAAGDLSSRVRMNTRDEFQTLSDSVNKMAGDLREYIANLTDMTKEKERIGAELDVATKIQASMLPCIFPAFPERSEFDIYALMQPAKEVGGDFYDFFLLDEKTLAVVMADVSGKGVPAALFMVIAKTLIKNNAQNQKSPSEVFETVNALLCEGNDSAMFVTAFLGYLDISSGEFTYVNAGHNLPLVRKAGGSFEFLSTPKNFVLAGMDGTRYKEGRITLDAGDELFLYTDGVTEAANVKNEMFSDARLLMTVNSLLNLPLKDFTVSVKAAVENFAAGAEQADDITMLTLKLMQNQ